MQTELFWNVVRLLLAVVLGGLIGLEREAHGRPAGLRTHILVSLGAALFTIVSNSYSGPDTDPGRIAAQIVSGIGFLGAGTIIRQGSVIRGLTTAASLWATAAIGMAAASRSPVIVELAIVASVIVFVTLSLISRVERAMIVGHETRDLHVTLTGGRVGLAGVIDVLRRYDIGVRHVRTDETTPGTLVARLSVRLQPDMDIGAIGSELASLPEVSSYQWV